VPREYSDVFDAVTSGDIDALLAFIEEGIDLAIPNIFGDTIFHLAAHSGNSEILEILASYNGLEHCFVIPDVRGTSALKIAVRNCTPKFISILARRAEGLALLKRYTGDIIKSALSSNKLDFITVLVVNEIVTIYAIKVKYKKHHAYINSLKAFKNLFTALKEETGSFIEYLKQNKLNKKHIDIFRAQLGYLASSVTLKPLDDHLKKLEDLLCELVPIILFHAGYIDSPINYGLLTSEVILRFDLKSIESRKQTMLFFENRNDLIPQNFVSHFLANPNKINEIKRLLSNPYCLETLTSLLEIVVNNYAEVFYEDELTHLMILYELPEIQLYKQIQDITIPEGYTDVPHDGHCFYSSIAMQMANNNPEYAPEAIYFHALAINNILLNPQQYIALLPGIEGIPQIPKLAQECPYIALNAYINHHLQNYDHGGNAWADIIMIQAISDALTVNIQVNEFELDGTAQVNPVTLSPLSYHIQPLSGEANETLTIAHIAGAHFASHGIQPFSG